MKSIKVKYACLLQAYVKCPVCLIESDGGDFIWLEGHFNECDSDHEGAHRLWLHRYAGHDVDGEGRLAGRLAALYDSENGLKEWIVRRLIERIYGEPPHTFILKLQHPDRSTIYGYVIEHHHFLMQWVRSCACIIARTDAEDVQLYEIDNIMSEFRGIPPDIPSHHELLLRMGESIGIQRTAVYSTPPLPATADALKWWRRIAETCHWVEAMAAMHTLELTANPQIKEMGSNLTYFDPAILEDRSYDEAVKRFLYEGYKADAAHSMDALELVEKYSNTPALVQNVKSVVFKTVDLLDSYLMARLDRGREYGSE